MEARLEHWLERLQHEFAEFKQNNQWLVEKYWQWYYKMNDVYQQVMSYPEAQQLKAIATEMVKTVSVAQKPTKFTASKIYRYICPSVRLANCSICFGGMASLNLFVFSISKLVLWSQGQHES